jgi:hypothetical protein
MRTAIALIAGAVSGGVVGVIVGRRAGGSWMRATVIPAAVVLIVALTALLVADS